MPVLKRVRPNTTTQTDFIDYACKHIHGAIVAGSSGAMEDRHAHLVIAMADLAAAGEKHLAALVQEIDEGRAYPSMLPFLHNKLAQQYGLSLTLL